LAKQFNVQKTVIGDIIRNVGWVDKEYTPPTRSHYFIQRGITSKKKRIQTKVIPVTVSKEEVQQIRNEYSTNTISQTELAKKYKISRVLVSDIINYKRGYAKI